MTIQTESVNRYGVYVFYDKDGIVDEYNYVFLIALRKNMKKLLIMCNGDVCPEGLARFQEIADEVVVRPNEGYDITAYRLGLLHYGYEELKTYDEVFICNNTCYGPLYPFSEMFEAMAVKDIDFWGITQFHEVPFDPFGTVKYGYLPKHIQSYFMVFRKSLVESKDFESYWTNFPTIHSYEEAIGFHEAIFTKEFADKGYKWDVYCNTDELENYTYEALRDYPRYLVEKLRCPIVKKRGFFHEYSEALSRSGGESMKEVMEYIEHNLSYDTGLMYRNLLRTMNQADLKKRLHWNYVLSSRVEQKVDISHVKVALVMHVYYSELAQYCASYVYSMPEGCDVYVTVPTKEKLEIVRKAFDEVKGYHIEYRIVGNLGRDVAPFLVGCKDIINQYDLICKMHDKKVYQIMPMSIGASWQEECFDNLLRNKTLVHNMIATFKTNPYMGMLTPPIPKHAAYYPTTGLGEWGNNFPAAKKLSDELNLQVNMDPKKEPIAPLGSMFWVRSKALKPLFDHDWQYEEFPKEPVDIDGTVLHAIERIYSFVAQSAGYYPGWVMSDHFARFEMTNWIYMNRELEKAATKKTGYCDYAELLRRITELS